MEYRMNSFILQSALAASRHSQILFSTCFIHSTCSIADFDTPVLGGSTSMRSSVGRPIIASDGVIFIDVWKMLLYTHCARGIHSIQLSCW
ncbi:hypothetical protein I7I48_11939 [Histoplasma ohiense]|nr:hypothetical protein I7I48_11939 [Histoplasma ohiense (nom. inval.)]